MRHPVEERGCLLGIAEDGDPFTELQIGGDDDASLAAHDNWPIRSNRSGNLLGECTWSQSVAHPSHSLFTVVLPADYSYSV